MLQQRNHLVSRFWYLRVLLIVELFGEVCEVKEKVAVSVCDMVPQERLRGGLGQGLASLAKPKFGHEVLFEYGHGCIGDLSIF